MFSFFLPWELLSESGPSAWLRRGPLAWREAEKRLGELKRPRCWVIGKTQDPQLQRGGKASKPGSRPCEEAPFPLPRVPTSGTPQAEWIREAAPPLSRARLRSELDL